MSHARRILVSREMRIESTELPARSPHCKWWDRQPLHAGTGRRRDPARQYGQPL